MADLVIELPPLQAWQQEVAEHPARFKCVVCGRRRGKTYLGVFLCFRCALEGGGRTWWVAPSYNIAREGWSALTMLVRQLPSSIAEVRESEMMVKFSGGGSVQVRSADNPDQLRGAGLDGVVLDEAAILKPQVWHEVLRPSLVDRQGWALFISTPKHFNWFFDLWELAGRTPGWARWQQPTQASEFIQAGEIEAARLTMDPGTFAQEFGAEFSAVGMAVFPEAMEAEAMLLAPLPARLAWERSGIGVDWGTSERHESCIVCVGLASGGAVWVKDAWFSSRGSGNELVAVAGDYWGRLGARYARFDASQASLRDDLRTVGYSDCEKGTRDVDGRIRHLRGLIANGKLRFNKESAGVRKLWGQIVQYHRNEDGRIVEERDDGVDALAYAVSELVTLADNPWSGWEAAKGLSTPTWLSRKVRLGG